MCQPHVHLEVQPLDPGAHHGGASPYRVRTATDPAGQHRDFYLRALRAQFEFLPIGGTKVTDPNNPIETARISTGEPLSVFPRGMWELPEWTGRIAWCEPEHVFNPANPSAVSSLAPGPDGAAWPLLDDYPFRLGQLRVCVRELRPTNRVLGPRVILARFLLSNPREFCEPVIGLHWSVLANRTLVRQTEDRELPPFGVAPVQEDWKLYDHSVPLTSRRMD